MLEEVHVISCNKLYESVFHEFKSLLVRLGTRSRPMKEAITIKGSDVTGRSADGDIETAPVISQA
jgi:hypothetical protein